MKLVLISLVLASSIADAFAAGVTHPSCKGVIHGIASDDRGQPVAGIRLTLDPLGVDLGYMLPDTQTNGAGEYRFEHVCPGRFTVLVDDEWGGYVPFYFARIVAENAEVIL